MPPFLAALLCTVLIVGLLGRDIKRSAGVSQAVWIPVAWILIIGSRLPSEWLVGRLRLDNPNAYLEGSPLDRNVFLLLMVLGAIVLIRRSITWSRFFLGNLAITIFFAYALLSVTWSDFPFVAFKRWYKVFGHLIMAMVILTDPQPAKAFSALFRRCAYVLLPLSVLFIKYYPELGRGFDFWTGAAVNPGVTTNKNALGNLCLVTVPFILASLFSRSPKQSSGARLDHWVDLAILVMAAWLVTMADSSAALVSTVLAAAVVCCLQIRTLRRQFTVYFVTVLALSVLLLTTTNLKDTVILALGETTTLTGRTDLWQDLQQIKINPIIGVGFESFWLGDRVAPLWEKYWWHPNQAHNGYYEMYLNLGILGLLAQAAMIVSGYRKARKEMLADVPGEGHEDDASEQRAQAYFKLAFLIGLLTLNLTDATFKALHLSFFVFFMVALSYPRPARVKVPVAAERPRLASIARTRRATIAKPRIVRARRATLAKPRIGR